MPDKKTRKAVRQPYALELGQTFATTLGNQTVTYIKDPKTSNVFSITLIWEKQGTLQNAAPYMIQISAGRLEPFNTSEVDRRLGIPGYANDYPISSTLMRRIPYEKIIDASRQALIANNTFFAENEIPLIHPISSDELVAPKKPGRPFDRPDSFYKDVANRYKEAKSLGGSIARKPAAYIEKYVLDEVAHLSKEHRLVQIRKWVAEARKRGYIPPVEE